MWLTIILVACVLKATNCEVTQKTGEKRKEFTGNETLEELMDAVDNPTLRLETAKLVKDKLGARILASLDALHAPENYDNNLPTSTPLPFDTDSDIDAREEPPKFRRQQQVEDLKGRTSNYLMDYRDADTKNNTVRLMKHIVFATQDTLRLFDPVVQKYSKFLRFRIAFTFRMLQQIGYDFRVLYLRLHNQWPKFRVTHSIDTYYYTYAFRKYMDIIYISEQIIRNYNDYKWQRNVAIEKYERWYEQMMATSVKPKVG